MRCRLPRVVTSANVRLAPPRDERRDRLGRVGAHKSATPNFSSDVSWSSTNEVSGTGWASGGIALSAAAAGGTSTVPTNTASPTGSYMYDMGDISVASTTLTNARAARIYADALAADNLIVLIDFDADYSTVNGTFGIQWASTGVYAFDLTP